jgi:hypothetical protein
VTVALSALALFVLAVVLDIIWVGWARAVRDERAIAAAAWSAAIQLAGTASVLLVVADNRIIAAGAAGHALGSYLGVRRTAKESNGAGDA